MMKMIIVALCVAAAVAMPIQDEESLEVSVEQTQDFGIIKKVWNHVFKKDVSEADVSCKMENCGGCETKYRTGRRLLEAEEEEVEQEWGVFSRRRRAPPKVAYSDCTKRDACLVRNTGCKAKIAQLNVAHEALKKELAEAKAELKEHSANAAAKAKAAAAEAEDAAVAKKAYEDQQAMISNLAKALSDKKHGETQDAEAEAANVAHEVKEDGEAKDDKKKATALMAKATKEFHQHRRAVRLLTPRRTLPRMPRGLLPLVPIRSPRLLVSPPVWSPAAKKRLADAQGALGGLHAAHMKEAGEAASAQAQAAAAEATRKLKEKNVANHQEAVNESAKKIGEQ
jgi:hypothetical protein